MNKSNELPKQPTSVFTQSMPESWLTRWTGTGRKLLAKGALASLTLASATVALAGPGGQCTLTDFSTTLQSTGTPVFVGAPGATNGDDASAADNIVRTNDSYVYRFNYKIPSGKVENNITFSSTLPLTAGKKTVVWDGLPAQCDGAGSSVSADGLTLICNIGGQDRQTEGDLVASVLAQVKATILGANNDIINATASVKTDDCAVGAVANAPAPPVTISARQKVDFRKDVLYTQQQGYSFSRTSGGPTEDGYLVAWYVYMDQFDPAGSSSKGGQAINSPVTFQDAAKNFPPGSIWFDCYRAQGEGQGDITCPPRYTPVSVPVGAAPGAALTAPALQHPITITARPGEENEFLVAGGKNTDVNLNPNTSQPQRLATFAVRFWVPLTAIADTANQTSSGQIDLNNKIENFVGTTNGASPVALVDQRTTNNELTNTVVATLPGSYYKYVARNWLGTVWNQSTYAGVNPGEYQLDGTNNWGDSGTALVYPNQVFFPRLDLYNPSAAATTSTLPFNINGPSSGISSILCENFDNNQVELAILPGSGGHAAGWYYGAPSTIAFGASGNANSTFPAGYKVEYGVANSGSGNPGRTSRCEDSDAQWFDTVTAADAVGKKDLLNKVRMKIPSLGGGQNTLFTIAQRTRPGLNGTYIIDYTPVKAANIRGADGVLGAWFDSSYTSRACTTCPTVPGDNTGLSTGKRVQLTTSLARVSKQAYASLAALATNQPASQAIANKTVTYVLTPSLQSIVPGLPTTFVTVQDRLPAPLTYVSGSASIPPDSIQTDAGGTTLSWTLNNVTPNTTLTTISFVALIPVDIPPNSSVNNLVYIDSPDDSSPLAQRTGDKALTVISPPGINVTKSTNTPLIEPNNTMTFKLAIANIEIAATTLDIIDVLPYVGDSAAVTQAPLAAQGVRNPSSAFSGTLFMNAGAVTVLSGGGASPVVRYSKKNPTVTGVGPSALLIDPSAPNNSTTVADGWCLVSEFGSNPNCPANIGQATAFRVSNYVLAGNSVGALQVQAATNGNTVGDLYTNRFGIRSDNAGFNFLRSNDVPVRVVLGSISGKVYVDSDGSATQGAPGAEPSLPGVTVQLCATDPALTSGACPAPVATTTTGPGGTYTFSNLISRPYWIVETKPAGYANGPTNATGSAGGAATPNNFSAINLPIGANASNYNFGHRLTDLVTTVKVPSAPVVPGSVVNATVTFGNVSQVASENTTATIKLNPNLTGVVVTPPPGWTLVSPYNATTGEITFAPSNPGATVTPGYSIDFPVSFNAPQTGTVTVTSRITNTIGDLTPINTPSSTDPKRNAHELPITVIPQRVDVRKAVGTPRNVLGSELTTLGIPTSEDVWLIPYRVTVGVASGGNSITATNVQLVDDLRATFPQSLVAGAPTTIDRVLQTAPATLLGTEPTGAFKTASAPNATSCGVASTAYNGTSSFTMLPAGVTLAPGESCTVEFSVLVRYLNPASTPVVAQLNTAVGYSSLTPVPAPTFPTPGSPTFATQPDSVDKSTDRPETPPNPTAGQFPPVPGTTGTPNGDSPDPTPVQLKPQVIDVRKSSSAMTQTDLSGKKFRTFYTVNAKNNGTSVLTNFQLSENLRFTFPAPAIYTVTNIVEVNPASGGTPSCGALNSNFDGGLGFSTSGGSNRNYNFIGTGGGGGISTQPLAAGAECVISFQVDVDYGTSNPPSAAPQNRIFGSTAAGGSNDGPPFEQATGLKAGDNPQLISKDTSTNIQPATPVFGVAPADPGPPTAPKNDLGSGSLTPLGTLEVVKSTTGPAVALSDRKYRVPYEMTVVARGSASFVLPNVQAIDNLAQAFQGGPTITVLPAASQTVVAIGGATCPANIATVASPNLTFFPGNTSLTVGQGCTFRFFVEVEYVNPAAVVTTIQYNQVYATSIAGAGPNSGGSITVVAGTSTSPFGAVGGSVAGSFAPPAGVLIAHDASTNGNTLPTSPAGDRPLPTPVQFPAPPTIDAVKFARNITRPGAPITTGDTVEWTVIYKNSGTTVANNVQVTDVRQSGYSSSFVVSAARIPENTIELIQPNAGYNGASDINLLFVTPVTPVNLAPGDQLVFKINSVVSSTSAAVTNQAILTANELGGPGGTKVLTSAVDKGITQACPSTNTCLPVGVTLPTDTITSTTATPGTKGQPNTLPIVPSAPITGKVFLDRDTNATFGAGDTTPLGTVTITLCRVNAPICPATDIQSTTTTNPTSGNYTFTAVPPGNYFLIETQPAGYGSSTPNSRPVIMAGVAIIDQDFGETAANVSGRVYQDNDASGAFGGSDTGIGGITVELCLSGDAPCTNPVRTTTTSPTSGTYTFADLPAPPVGQTYYIKEGTIPATLTNATTTVGSLTASPGTAVTPGTADSPTSRINGITWTPSVTPATTPTAVGINYNFGELPLSSISGSVILDTDRSGGQTGTETGIPNVTTTLTLCRTNNSPCLGADIVSTTTSAPLTGSYTFANVTPGTYFVIETQPPGYASSSVNSLPVTLTATSIVGQNFFETAADISGTVYNDNNASGVFDATDTPISGATMRLCLTSQSAAQCASNPKATTTTLPTGSYTFANIPAPPSGDSYVIVEDESVAPLTLVANGTATVGALTGGTSQVNGSIVATEQVPTFTGNSTINAISFVMPTAVATGAPVVGLGYNFGELPVAGISGKVFLDKDFTNGTTGTNNPTTDTPLLNNATTTVTLCSADPGPSGICPPASVVATTVTAANGDYSFPNVPAGNFWVVETQPAGYGSSSPNVQPVVRADATAVTNVNFADTLAEIKGRVYQDNNASGTSDAPDVGIGGVIVQLCLSSDTACASPVQSTTTTPTSGTYTFANVPAPPAGQTYFIKEGVIPAGLQNGTTTVGNLAVSGAAAAPVGAANSPASTINNITWTPTVAPFNGLAAVGTDYNFGELPLSSISGSVILDTDRSGGQTGTETGIPNVTTTLTLCRTNNSPCLGADIVSTTTSAPLTGSYTFANVTPGTYFVIETQPPGYASSSVNSLPVTLTATSIVGQNFFETAADISGTVYNDNNASGVFDATDTPISGATMRLCLTSQSAAQCASNPKATTTTLPTGSYTFANIPAPPSGDSYVIVEDESVAPLTLVANGTATVGALTGGTSQVNGSIVATEQVPTFTGNSTINAISFVMPTAVATGAPVVGLGYNFGELPVAGISGKVFLDKDFTNGTTGTNNPATDTPLLNNATTTVTLCSADPGPSGICPPASVVATTVTAANGDYSFPNVPAGNFWVVETQPAGYGSSSPNVQPVVRLGSTPVANVNFADTLAEIKGRVYQDNNASGTSDAPDVGIGGVIVQLCLSSDTACASPVQSTTTTPTSGTYTFANVPAPPAGQTYFIKEGVIPAGLQNGTTTVGNLAVSGAVAAPVGAANSPASTINNITWTPTVAPFNGLAAAGTDYNFGELPVTTISGSVILDRNFDGLPNGTDSGLPVTTTLTLCRTNSNPCVGSDIVSTTTSSPTNGSYSFANVTPGNYFVIQTQPTGYASTSPNGLPVNAIGTTPITGVNFLESGAQLSGTVYKDVNYNGTYNPTGATPDIPLLGVVVQLCSTSNCAPGSVIATSTTTAAGLYEFKDLPAPPAGQQYFILENQSTVPPTPTVLSDGTTNVGTFTTQGGATAVPGTPVQTPSRVDGIFWTPATSVVNGTASVVGTNFNFGEIEGLDIAGRVYYDKDRNGASNEPAGNGINAVTITLCRSATVLCPSSDVVGTTTTTVDGNYSFTRIPPGAYFVQESQPAGYGSTPTTAAPTATDVRPITLTNVNLAGVDFADTLGSLAGLVYLDRNGNQSRDIATEETRPGVTVTLTGIDASGVSVTRTAVTNASGTYQFDDLKAGTYSVAETQDPAFGNGAAHPGSTGGTGAPNSNVISAIALPVATDSINNNFGDVPKSGGVSGSLWRDNDHDRIKDPGEPAMPGWTVQLFRDVPGSNTPTLVTSAVSDANGAYSITGQEVGPGYSVRFLAPNGTVFSGAVNGEQGPGSAQANGGTTTTGGLRGINLQENTVIPFQSLPVDPAGVVYDSDTRLPVAGATVRFGPIGSCAAYDPAIHLFGGAANATQVTAGAPPASAGFYQFLLLDNDPLRPLPANCVYGVTVTPPAGFVADPAIPSLGTLPAQPKPPNEPFLIAPNSGAPQAGEPTTWYQAFNLGPNSRDIVNNHIPLVSNNRPVLFISKVAGKTSVELGDNVKYTVKVRYVSGTASLPVIRVVDSMPAGFKLIPGTSFVSVPTGAAVSAVPAGNITGAPGAVVTYNIPLPGGVFNVGQELELTYRVRVGVGSLQGDGINRAQANSVGVVRSNIAQAKVKVNPGVFTSEACIVGKIYTDCNNNHIQDAEEVGVPGVRLYLQDGTYMVSDSEGKYSLCGLEPTSHVLKVDQLTLPRGSRLTTTSNRNLGNADSLWLDLKNGEMQQADFAIGSCSNTVLEQVKARRAQGGVRSVDNESKGGAALKFEGKNPNYPDQGTDSANQHLVKPRPPQSPGAPPPGEAENNIPVPQLPAASSNTPGNNIRLTK